MGGGTISYSAKLESLCLWRPPVGTKMAEGGSWLLAAVFGPVTLPASPPVLTRGKSVKIGCNFGPWTCLGDQKDCVVSVKK